MAPTDVDTPRYISEAIGDQTRMVRVKSWQQRGWDAASIQERQEGIRLIRPEQIRMLGPDVAIALVRDQNPVRLFKARYYEDRDLKRVHEDRTAADAMLEPPVMPEAPLPGAGQPPVEPAAGEQPAPAATAHSGEPERITAAPEEQTEAEVGTPALEPDAEAPVKLRSIRDRSKNLQNSIAEHRARAPLYGSGGSGVVSPT